MHSVPGKSQPTDWLLPLGTLFFACGIWLGRSLESLLPALLGLALCLIALLLFREGRRLSLLATIALLGAAAGYAAYHPPMPPEGECIVCGVVTQEISLGDKGQVQTRLSDVTLNGLPQPDAYWTFYLDEGKALPDFLQLGVRVQFSALVYHPSDAENPGGFSFREYLLQRGVRFGVYGAKELRALDDGFSLRGWAAAVRHDLTRRLMAVMGEETGAYAAAMLLGTQHFLPQDDRAAFSDLGVAHILSVSGFHVGLLAALLRRMLRPFPIPRIGQALLLGAMLFTFCLVTGESAPAIRAAGLMLLRECVRLRQRQILPLHLLCLMALIQLAANPTLLTGPSFQLSYAAMLGIIIVFPQLNRRCRLRSAARKWLWEALSLSVAAQTGLLLPQLYWFGKLPLLELVLNLAVTGISSGLILLYWAVLAALPLPLLAENLGALSARVTEALLAAVRRLAELDFITLWTRRPDGYTFLGWALLLIFSIGSLPESWAFHRRRMLLLGAALLCVILLPQSESSTVYTQFSAGNADAAVLQDRNMTVVIDTGEDGQALANYLHQQRQEVEILVITHLHSDHAGGIAALLSESVPVKTCYLPANALVPAIDPEVLPLLDALTQSGADILPLSRGDAIPLPSGSLRVLWPLADHASSLHSANDMSLVLQADIAGVTMLLTGDMSGTYEQYAALPSDILKAAHHGSASSTSPEFLAAMNPRLILLSNGNESRSLRMAELAGEIPLYDTNRHGAITIRFLENGEFEVSTVIRP